MKLSIITINYNKADDLAKTIRSVVNQSYQEYEYIIIDGGSNDGSVDVIREYENRIDYWVSGPDRGIFHAMNKGIEKASGEYLLMLNAGDCLCDDKVLERVFSSNNYPEDILTGDVYRAVEGKVFQESRCPDHLTFDLFRKGSLSHQGTFIKRRLHDKVGMYDERLQFSSDWKFFVLAICKHNVSYRHLPFFIAVCDCGGMTCNPKNFPHMEKEMQQVLHEHFPAFLRDYESHDRTQTNTIRKKILSIYGAVKFHFKQSIIGKTYS